MLDNPQNNWKTWLQDPERLPRETIRDKNEAWEKLYARLHKKPQRKPAKWYWAAAALLVVAGSGILIWENKGMQQNISVIIPSPAKKQIPATSQRTLSIEQKNNVLDLPNSKHKSNITVSNQKNTALKTMEQIDHDFITDSIINQLPAVGVLGNRVSDSATKSITAAIPVKKKLRVVHLNEIGQPIEEPIVNGRYTEKHGFDLKIITGEMYNPVNSSSSNNGLILNKPRNTSN